MDLSGAVGIVTGGATGIGHAVCLELARAGARGVVVNYSRSAAEAEATAKELAGLGVEAVVGTQDEFRAFMASEKAMYTKLIADNNIKGE